MCIIISKNKNCDRLPTIGELENCFNYNSDGAGFMYVNNNKVIIEKGFMELKSFLNRFKELCNIYNDFKNKSLVIHCRIGTSSGNTPENTHPYAVTTKENKLHKLNDATDLGIVHNGIISAYTPKNKNASVNDTQKFILEYLAPIYKHYKNFYKNEKFRAGIKAITGSKFVFLDKNDNTYYVGDFVDEKGLKFSNTTYKTLTTYTFCQNSKYLYCFDDDFEKIYTKNDCYYDYFDKNENLIYLKPNWFFWVDDTDTYEQVSSYDCDLVYSLDKNSLFVLDDNGELMEISQDVRVYDENFLQIE